MKIQDERLASADLSVAEPLPSHSRTFQEERNQPLLDFFKILTETSLFTTVSQQPKKGLLPAGSFAIPVALNQVVQNTLGAALVVVMDRGQLLRLCTGIKTEFLLDLLEESQFSIVASLETRQNPALALGVSESNDDSLI